MPENKLPLRGTFDFDVTTHNPTTGAVSDADWVPQYEVFENATDTPVIGTINLTKRTNKTGDYRGRLYADPTVFSIGRFYNIIVSGTVNSVAGKVVRDTFQISPSENVPGVSPANVSHLSDSAIQQSGGYQKISEGTGTGQLDLTSGRPGIDWSKVSNPTTGLALSNTQIGTVISFGQPARNLLASALSDINLDQLVKNAVGVDFATSVHLNSIIGHLADDGTVASFDRTTDSLEAIRNRGDAAWTTGGAGSITDILNVVPLIPLSLDLANTATVRIGMMLTNAVDDLPSTAEITPGTIAIDRKAIGGTSWTNIVNDEACSESAGLIYYDEVFDSGSGYAEGDSIRITFKSQKITVAANDYEITDTTGRFFYTEIRQTMRGTNSAFLAASAPTNFSSLVIGPQGVIPYVAVAGTLQNYLNNTPQTGNVFPSMAPMFGTLSAIKLKTDNLPSDPADASDILASFTTAQAERSTMYGTLSAIKAKTDNLPASPAAVGSAMTLTSGERDSVASALLNLSNGVETSLTVKQALQLVAAVLAGQLSGAATTTITIKAANNPSTTRVTATVTSDGNRTGLTLNI